MLKIIGTLLIMSVLTLTAQAETTRFDELLERFSKGTLPTKAEIVGPTRGSCYRKHMPNTEFVTHLMGRVLDGEPQGPLFPKTEKLEFAVFWSYFVNMDIFENSRTQIVDDAWVSRLPQQDNRKLVVKKSDGYLFAVVITQRDTERYKAGETIASCYFYERENFP